MKNVKEEGERMKEDRGIYREEEEWVANRLDNPRVTPFGQ
jgi:hypothetical protein